MSLYYYPLGLKVVAGDLPTDLSAPDPKKRRVEDEMHLVEEEVEEELHLSDETINHIFSFLRFAELRNFLSVSRQWHKIGLEHIKHKSHDPIQELARIVSVSLQNNILQEVARDPFSSCTTVNQIKSTFSDTRKKMGELLSELSLEDLGRINKTIVDSRVLPQLFGDYLSAVRINEIRDIQKRRQVFVDLILTYIITGHLDKADAICTPQLENQLGACSEIARQLAQRNLMSESFVFIRKLKERDQLDVVGQIVAILDVEAAFRFAKAGLELGDCAYEAIFFKALDSGQRELAVKALSFMRDPNNEAKFLKVLENYERLVASYADRSHLNAGILMKAIAVALERFSKEPIKETLVDEKVMVQESEGKISLTYIEKVLGSGSYGKVYQAQYFAGSEPEKVALKFAEVDPEILKDLKGGKWLKAILRAEQDIKNEYAILCYLHQDGSHPAIQAVPHRMVQINGKGGEQVGFMGALYAGSLKDAFNEKLSKKLQRGELLLQGLAYLDEMNVAHMDINPANVLIRSDATVIGDFGGAIRLDQNIDGRGFVINSEYQYPPLFDAMDSPYVASPELILRHDLFSMGVTLYQLFLGEKKFPYRFLPTFSGERIQLESVDQKKCEEDLLKAGVPPEIAKLVTTMIFDTSMEKDADEVFKEYARVMQNLT